MTAIETHFADAYGNQLAHLVGPLTSGARASEIALDASGRGQMDSARYPALLIAPRADVGADPLVAVVAVQQGDTAGSTVVTFAPFTQRGTFLLAFAPDHPEPEISPSAAISVTSAGLDAATAFELRVIEGQLGRLLYLTSFEKHRLRRQARLLGMQRFSATASGESLDRIGAELGVVRFPDTLVWDKTTKTPSTDAPAEDDERYRRRLRLMRPFLMPTRSRLDEALNGPGDPTTPNAGLLAELGVTDRVTVRESGTELSVAVALFAPNDDALRQQYLQYLHGTWLLHPDNPAELDTRLLENGVRVAQKALLARLKKVFTLPAGSALSPELSIALDRLARILDTVGRRKPVVVTRAQDATAGSRYELGFGVDITPPTTLDFEEIADLIEKFRPDASTSADTAALIASIKVVSHRTDPLGRWLFEPCGIQTVHPTAAGAWYLSHLPTHGLRVEVSRTAPFDVDARYDAPGDPGPHVLLWQALSQIDSARGKLNVAPWTVLSKSDLVTAATQAVVPAAAVVTSLQQIGLRTATDVSQVQAAASTLAALDDAATVAVRLDSAFAGLVLAGQTESVAAFGKLVAAAQRAGVVSSIVFQTQNGIVWVLGTLRVPGPFAAFNTGTPSFHFSAVRLVPPASQTMAAASFDVKLGKAQLLPGSNVDVCAVVVWSLPYRAGDDFGDFVLPGHVRIDLPSSTRLSLGAYEFLMNTLSHVHPLGVTIDTASIREQHVVPVAGGPVVPMVGRASRTFRPFFQRRHLGGRDFSR